jgi:predicted TIM-barrel fold metal-dependent hydrolase
MLLQRREFIATALASAGASIAFADEPKKRSIVVDAHLHCFAGKDDKRFPYHANGPYKPDAAATPEHLLKCMDGAGVDFAVVVHPEPYQDDHRYLEHCLEVGKRRLKGTCLFFAGTDKVAERMKELAKKVALVTARVHAYSPERLPPFGKPELKDLWKTAGDLGLAVQLHFEPRYAEGFEPLIRDFKDVKVIIDHLGRPFQGTPKEHEVVVKWSRFANTIMKISAVPDKTQYPHRDVGPIVKQLTDAFGADRLIYGGGFSERATGDSYRKERERIAHFLAHLSKKDQDKVLGGTAMKLFRFA